MNDEMKKPGLDAPLVGLRPSTQKLLSAMLNPIKVLPTESGLPRDWRGLAELAGFTSELIRSLETQSDPTEQIFKKLIATVTHIKSFSDLTACLNVIDRYDVIEDATSLLHEDAELYFYKTGNNEKTVTSIDVKQEADILTFEDSVRLQQGLPLPRYDAFILYSEEDSDFANQVVEKMEYEYNLKLCIKDRDLLPGVMFEHEVIGRLIEERCNRLLVIFSPSFLKSTANQFLVSYAQALALDLRVRKIIPCLYKHCVLPPSVRYSFCLDYNRSSNQWNFFWDKLGQSLQTNPITKERKISTPVPSSKSINVDTSKYATSMPDSISWWDAQKEKASSKSNKGDSGIVVEDDGRSADTVSMNSGTFLLSNSSLSDSKENKSKWFHKITTPIKKIRQKGKNAAIAE